jgi:TatD DNase family protein
MKLIDTHCHLNHDQLVDNVIDIIKRAKGQNVEEMYVVGWDEESSITAIRLSEKHKELYAIVGIHPTDTGANVNERLMKIKTLLSNHKVVALGEIGFDFHWQKEQEQKKIQEEFFIKQLELANQMKMPVVIHSRSAILETYSILKKYPPKYQGVVHCYSGPLEMVNDFLDLGLYISLGGPVTFHNAKQAQEVAKQIPLDRLLLETDSPYLAPMPYRGKGNEPAYLPLIAQAIATIKQISLKQVVKITSRNAKELFHVKHI